MTLPSFLGDRRNGEQIFETRGETDDQLGGGVASLAVEQVGEIAEFGLQLPPGSNRTRMRIHV